MKILPIVLALAAPLHAGLVARIETDKGSIDVELQYTKAPQAVANFITLSQGTGKRLDVTTGAINNKRFYVGEKFYRVENTATFKIAQTGSGNGTNVGGGPGYTFKDEFDSTLTFEPYVLAMANSGLNSNGSQIFLTGNATAHHLDNVHTLFGLIPDAGSRAVVDAILAAGNNGATITGVTISRTDAAAQGFNEFAQQLPEVICPPGRLSVTPGVSTTWNFDVPLTGGDTFRGFTSSTLAAGSWTELDGSVQIGMSTPPLSFPSIQLDSAAASKAFYNLAVVKNPTSLVPASLANRTILMPLPGANFQFVFDATGVNGVTTVTPAGGNPFSGTFHTYDANTGLDAPPIMGVHNVVVGIARNEEVGPVPFYLTIGCDSVTSTSFICRHRSYYYDGTWRAVNGTLTISR